MLAKKHFSVSNKFLFKTGIYFYIEISHRTPCQFMILITNLSFVSCPLMPSAHILLTVKFNSFTSGKKCSVSDNSRKYSTEQNCEMAYIIEKRVHRVLFETWKDDYRNL